MTGNLRWACAAALLLTVGMLAFRSIPQSTENGKNHTYRVQPQRIQPSFIFSGDVGARTETVVTSGVYNLGEYDNTYIISVVEDGTSVKRGDVILEMDNSEVRERLDRYETTMPKIESRVTIAETRLANQKTRNRTNRAEAEQKLALAKLAKSAYIDSDCGTYQTEWSRLQGETRQALARLKIANEKEQHFSELFRVGYRSLGEYNRAKLNKMDAESELVQSVAETQRLNLIEEPQTLRKLEQEIVIAEKRLQQVLLDGQAELQRREATLLEAQAIRKKYADLLARYRQQVENFTVVAPHDGICIHLQDKYGRRVVYEGAPVYWKQRVLMLTDLEELDVRIEINELDRFQLDVGQDIEVEVNGHETTAEIVSFSPLPKSNRRSPEVLNYSAVATLRDSSHAHPGMTAVTTIQMPTIQSLAVPLSAVHEDDGEFWVECENEFGTTDAIPIELGRRDEQWVEVLEGLNPDDVVIY